MDNYQSRVSSSAKGDLAGSSTLGDALTDFLDRGNREGERKGKHKEKSGKDNGKQYRVRTPTRSERLNRALKELRPGAFKVHALIWAWRGAPARGNLPFFTIRSLEKFCNLTRPTIRKAFDELVEKKYIVRLPYNAQCKNALYRLVPVRKIPKPT